MGDFLYVLLIGFLGALLFFVLLIVGGYFGVKFWFRWKFGKYLEQLKDFGGAMAPAMVPPMRLNFHRDDDLNWADEEALKRDTAYLLAEGFQQVGDFEAEESPVSMRAFVHTEKRIWAAIQSVYGMKQWTDLVTRYADGTTCTFANLADHGMDRPPWRTAYFLPDTTIPDLLERCLADRPPGKAMLSASAEDFPEVVSDAYAREMDWRMERGGVTVEEIVRTLAKDNQMAEPHSIRMIQFGWTQAISTFLDDQCQQKFLEDGGVSAREWEEVRDRVLVIHDRTPANAFADLLFEDDDDESSPEDLWSGAEDDDADESPRLRALRKRIAVDGPRTVFAEINAGLPEGRRSRKVGQVTVEAVTADFYVLPDWEDDNFDDDD